MQVYSGILYSYLQNDTMNGPGDSMTALRAELKARLVSLSWSWSWFVQTTHSHTPYYYSILIAGGSRTEKDKNI